MIDDLPQEKAALKRAVDAVGGTTAFATLLGFKDRRNVWPWVAPGSTRQFPAEHCPTVERATRALNALNPVSPIVTCEELRPDVSWDVLRLQAAPLVPPPPVNPTAPTPRASGEHAAACEPPRVIVDRGEERRERPGELGGRRAGQRREG